MESLVHIIVLALFAGAAVAIAGSLLKLAGVDGTIRGIPLVGEHLDAILVILLVWALDMNAIIEIGRDNDFLQYVVDGVALYSVIAMASAIRDGFAGRAKAY